MARDIQVISVVDDLQVLEATDVEGALAENRAARCVRVSSRRLSALAGLTSGVTVVFSVMYSPCARAAPAKVSTGLFFSMASSVSRYLPQTL